MIDRVNLYDMLIESKLKRFSISIKGYNCMECIAISSYDIGESGCFGKDFKGLNRLRLDRKKNLVFVERQLAKRIECFSILVFRQVILGHLSGLIFRPVLFWRRSDLVFQQLIVVSKVSLLSSSYC